MLEFVFLYELKEVMLKIQKNIYILHYRALLSHTHALLGTAD